MTKRAAKKIIVAERSPLLAESTADYATTAVPAAASEYVSDGNELVERVRKGGYSLVIVGCCVDGDQDGPDIVRRIREFDEKLPVYVLSVESGAADRATRERAEEAGATGYLSRLSEGTKSLSRKE